ncbi:MAG: LacI family DNA-binding transcriptional regulator [Verrucomicrobiae bacterium]|nr:LacI family DNA-binding transcriptional regulator [Verrucomicrobiae bacterium]
MVTQRQIAERLKLSCSTVANILGKRAGLRYGKQTRERVLKTAAELGYQRNRAAQAIRQRRSNLIGIVHFGAGIEAAHKANLALSAEVHARGYDYLAVDMNWHGGSVERVINELIQARVEGVLISHIQEVFRQEHVDALRRVGIPVGIVNGESRAHASLYCDDVFGAFQALTRHLIQVGHRRILHLWPGVATTDQNRAMGERLKGFRSAFEGCGTWTILEEEEVLERWPNGFVDAEGVMGLTVRQPIERYSALDHPVYRFCERLFAKGALPDAIVCTNDMYALELIAAGLAQGVRIPEDLALTGYDNDRVGAYPAFGLTTAEQDLDGICAASAGELFRRIAHPGEPPGHRIFPSKLILRTSCGRRSAAPEHAGKNPSES